MELILKRGDIYWVNLEPSVGSEIKKKRPCVIIGATIINQARRTIVVIPLSTAGNPRPPLTVEVNCLEKKAVAVCDQIRAVDKSRVLNKIGELKQEELFRLENGLRQVLAL
jgi:mRNA interferase MazF